MSSLKSTIILVLSFLLISAYGQNRYTPYDDLPGVIKSYKPAYSNDFPSWAKMLYEYPVNYKDVVKEFENWHADHRGERTPEYRYFRIWQRAVEPYVLNDGTIRLPDLKEYERELRRSQLQAGMENSKASRWVSDWTFLGPKETFWLNENGSPVALDACPWQVNVYSFDVAASDHDILYCGTETGFVNKTADKGQNWQLIAPDYYFGGGVTAVAIHPGNPDIVYVAAGNQVHKTTDGGDTWTPLLPEDNLFHADRLRIDPVNPDKIFAAATDGVYVSTDAGATWQNKWEHHTYDVEVKPDDSEVVFALADLNGKFSMVMSVNGGESFSIQAAFPSTIVNHSGGLLAVTPDNPDRVWVVMLSADNTPYLYRGDYDGNWSWSLLATGQTGAFPMNNGQGYFDLVLDVAPDDENTIFAGTTTLFKSENGGQTFTVIGGYYGNFHIHPDDQDIKLLSDGEAWISTDGGFSLSSDNFTSTNNYVALNNGLVGSDMWGFHQGWDEDIVVGGRYHNGNTAMAGFYQPKALRMGGAESPTGWVIPGKSRHVAYNDLGNGWILPPDAESEPEGRFIFSKYPNMDEYGGRRGNMVFHPNYYGTVCVGEGDGFWKSTDMGVTFDLLHNFNARVRYLEISYSNPDVIYADVVGKGLMRSDDGGETWELKPSLTGGEYGNYYWKGRLFLAVSPYDENVVYACLQNGMWSTDIGKVFKSTDGGDTWENWTGTLSERTKCLVLQPDGNGSELVYLFTNAGDGQPAKVYVRNQEMDEWESFDNNYPAGMWVNLAMPFYRDNKIRVGGRAGVWETSMETTNYDPIINPWVEKSFYNCMLDTLYFNDHSIMDYEGVTWHWEITPEPAYISDPDVRNPQVVLGAPGSYDVQLTVTKNGMEYTKLIPEMVTTTTCPSIDDCNNPAEVPKDIWSLVYVDSEEINDPGYAVMSFDDDPSTIWHTRWSTGDDPYPHEIQVDMGRQYKVFKFTYLNRQDGENGRIKDYKLYFSDDTEDWGDPVSEGQFVNTAAPQTVELDSAVVGQYFRLLALSEVNGNPWASAAEFYVTGCTDITGTHGMCKENNDLKAFPVPASGNVKITLPEGKAFNYRLIALDGRVIKKGIVENISGYFDLSLNDCMSGVYFVHLQDKQGVTYRVKLIKR
jgi:photosystem II stability/assembly factor-like uncharacterized protein